MESRENNRDKPVFEWFHQSRLLISDFDPSSLFPKQNPTTCIRTDSAQSSSNKCKNYLLKIYSQHGNFLKAILKAIFEGYFEIMITMLHFAFLMRLTVLRSLKHYNMSTS